MRVVYSNCTRNQANETEYIALQLCMLKIVSTRSSYYVDYKDMLKLLTFICMGKGRRIFVNFCIEFYRHCVLVY